MHRFTTSQLGAIRSAALVLLSPLDYPDSVAWREAATQAVARAAAAPTGGVALPTQDGRLMVSDGYDRKAVDEYSAYFHRHNPVNLRRLTPGRRVWVREELCPASEFLPSEYYNDWCLPYGNLDSAGMRTRFGRTEEDESYLVLNSRSAGQFRPGSQVVDLLTFLQPAFAAGVRLALLGPQLRQDWSEMLDALPVPGFLIGVSGRILHVPALGRALLGRDPDEAGLMAFLRAWAVEFADAPAEPALARRVIERPHGRLVVRAALLNTGPLVGQEPVVLFTTEPLTPHRATPREALRMRFLVTPREAEVAELIAAGLSTKEIADRLGISIHTARRHSEHLFSKLGLRRRAEVAALIARLGQNDSSPTTH